MHPLNRRGYTLVEVLIGLTLAGLVAGTTFRVLTESQRITRSLNGRVDAQQNARTAALYLSTALREINSFEGDVVEATASELEFRAMRWAGLTCSGLTTAGSDLQVVVRATQLFGYRAPDAALDSMFVYVENDVETRADDQWLDGRVMGVATGTCDDGATGTQLTFQISAGSGGNGAAASFTEGSPLRGYQREELTLFTDVTGISYLGSRTMNSAGTWTGITELLGPLMAGGLSLSYFDTLGVATAALDEIASIGVVVRTESRESGRTSAGAIDKMRDSIVTRIALRNNRRF